MRTGGRVVTAFFLLSILFFASPVTPARADQQNPESPVAAPIASIADKTKGMEKRDGLLPLYIDEKEGKLWIEVPRLGQEMIYQISLSRGIGSNDLGLDRGKDLGETRVVRFDRWGNKVLLVQPNVKYRALTDNADERRSVEESFAESVLWGFTLGAESEGRVLVDATDFLTGTDLYGIVATLKDNNAGAYRLEASRSAIFPPGVKAFPRNSEIEAILTFTSDRPGDQVKEVAPTPEAITVHARHSFVALPEPGYVPRAADPRAGYFFVEFADYAAPLGQPLEQRLIARHRLRKEDPRAPVSRAVEPIVYYVDRGVPEPIRTALMEGARWWSQAFEAAGYLDAFRVELLPEGADPLDVRYNVIELVHRATRGWSFGTSVVDPRTGEIIKGHVRLGSLRDRQDLLIAEGLLSPYEHGDEHPPELEAFALARLRQLVAHELGHTLGLRHNFLASAENRASVMDYPYPLARLTPDGRVDLSEAYAAGIGDWDKVAIAYGYQDFPDGTDEREALDRLLADARARGLTFLTDSDANPGGVHPQAHRWDNGTDAAAELRRVMEVRRAALNRFGERAVRAGLPLATMEEVLVPVYLHHRYQVEAAAKLVGGQWYTYAMRGDGQQPLLPVAAASTGGRARRLAVHVEPRGAGAARDRAQRPAAAAVHARPHAGAVRGQDRRGLRRPCARDDGRDHGRGPAPAARAGDQARRAARAGSRPAGTGPGHRPAGLGRVRRPGTTGRHLQARDTPLGPARRRRQADRAGDRSEDAAGPRDRGV